MGPPSLMTTRFFTGPSTLTRYEIMSTSFSAIKYASDTRHTIKQSLIEPLKEIQQKISQLRRNEFFEDQLNQKHLDKLDMIFNYIILQLGDIDLNSKIADIMGDGMESDTASLTDSRLSLFDDNVLASLSRMNSPTLEEQRENYRPIAPFNTSDGRIDDSYDVASTCTSNYQLLDKTEAVKYPDYSYICTDLMDINSSASGADNVESSTIDMAYYLSIVNGAASNFIPITSATSLNEPFAVDELCDFIAQVGFIQSTNEFHNKYHTRPMHLFRQHEHKICIAYNKYIEFKIKELTDVMGMGSALITHGIKHDPHLRSTRYSRHPRNSHSKRSANGKSREVSLLDVVKTSSVVVARISQIMDDYHAFLGFVKKEC